jgi:hypothetical protein
MRKALTISALVIVLVAAGLFAWQYWLRQHTPPLFLTLQLSDEREVTATQGTPLFFKVFLSGSKTGPAVAVGSEDQPWYRLLRLESIDSERPVKVEWSTLGEPHALTVRLDPSGNPAIDMYRGGKAVIDRDRSVYSAEFGITPEDTAKIAPGRHQYRAILDMDSRFPWEPRVHLVSRAVTVMVEPAAAADLARLVESTRFYLRAKRFDDAFRLAQQLTQREPNEIRSYVMLGDALNGLRRDQEALGAYEHALLLIEGREPRPRGHPDYLYLRIEEVQRRVKH